MKRYENPYFLTEGVSYNRDKTVSYDFYTENNVDTNEEHNPNYDTYLSKKFGVDVYSIFKRKNSGTYGSYENSKLDGNPLLYALKGINGWKFSTEYDKQRVWKQIENICSKFIKLVKFEATIVVPSKSNLNKKLADILKRCNSNCTIFDQVLVKMDTLDIENMILSPDSLFSKKFSKNLKDGEEISDYDYYLDELYSDLDKMDELEPDKEYGTFRIHLISDDNLRNVITRTLKFNTDADIRTMSEAFDGKNVVIIDDSVSRGTTIKNAIDVVNEHFTPKTLRVLTLFSRKYNEI